MFYGNGQTHIETFNQLAQACSLYRGAYGQDKMQLIGYLPEDLLYDLTRNSFSGDMFARVKWVGIEMDSHLSNFQGGEEVKIHNYTTHVGQNSLEVCSIIVPKGNYCDNDRLQVYDGYHIAENARYVDSPCPVQFRVKSIMHYEEHDELFVESLKQLNRPFNDDKLCILPSFKAGGICCEDGSNPMLMAFPHER